MATGKDFNIDELLNSILNSGEESSFKPTLNGLFLSRLEELNLTETAALSLMGVNSRTLKGILEGNQKMMDFTNLVKLSSFLQVPYEYTTQLYVESLVANESIDTGMSPEIIKFIHENFDLATMKKDGFISDITNYVEICEKVSKYFGLNDILEYSQPADSVAFSSGASTPKNPLTRKNWIKKSQELIKEIGNPYDYDRAKLIEYFPEIRWHSTDEEVGLLNVIQHLYKLGVTVVYQYPSSNLKLRGATFSINNKPAIVLTNLSQYYATLWFALVHELFHVLFDWEEIFACKYHISDEENDQATVRKRENEADEFSRKYLFSKEKTMIARTFINDSNKIKDFAKENHVHPSLIYTFNAFDRKDNGSAWKLANEFNVSIDSFAKKLGSNWNSGETIKEHALNLKKKYYK